MRDHPSIGMLMTAANGRYTLANTAAIDVLHPSTESEVRSPMSTDSQFSVLTAASSTASQTHNYEWPEFQESYNSIMDNTNLLDSCAEALNEISSDEGVYTLQSDKVHNDFHRSFSSTSSVGGPDKVITSKKVDQFRRWLCDMENRVAAQPKLVKIVDMKPKRLKAQLKVHLQLFDEIAAQSWIVKEADQTDDKSYQKRYLLVYLEVYEVLLLLDKNFSPSNQILNKSCLNIPAAVEQLSNQGDDSDNHLLNEPMDESQPKTPMYNETSVLSTSIGTYYFNYDDSIVQQADKEQLSSTVLGSDKEFTFEHDLHSLFNATDSLCVKSPDRTLVSELTPLRHSLASETVVGSRKDYIWNKFDLSELAARPTDNYLLKDIEAVHRKVYDWLNSKADSCRSKSTATLSSLSDTECQLLYRTRSEMDLPSFRPMLSRASSLQTSVNCLPSLYSPIKIDTKSIDSTASSTPEDNSLLWDNFQLDGEFAKPENEANISDSDSETKELINKLCYFGDDYSLHLNEQNSTECDKPSDVEQNAIEMHSLPQNNEPKLRRSLRIQQKQLRMQSPLLESAESCDTQSVFSLGESSGHLSDATTATAKSKLMSTFHESDQNASTAQPEQLITYNSAEKHFELRTKNNAEPKRMNVNEMKAEDFYDIVKMCQNNIDCVITVLGAEPNRILTVTYCQQMKAQRQCKCTAADATMKSRTTECKCKHMAKSGPADICVCAWVSHTIAMIFNFLFDCWNIFRNMKLYTYLCRVTRALFGSTRFVADHLKAKRELVSPKAIKYS